LRTEFIKDATAETMRDESFLSSLITGFEGLIATYEEKEEEAGTTQVKGQQREEKQKASNSGQPLKKWWKQLCQWAWRRTVVGYDFNGTHKCVV